MLQQNIRPSYEVEFVDEVVIETHYAREDGRNVERKVEVPYGYNVYFPAGHSIRVRTDADLARLGFNKPAELVDMDSGDEVGTTAQSTLKQHVQRRAGASKRRADTSAVDANQGD